MVWCAINAVKRQLSRGKGEEWVVNDAGEEWVVNDAG